MSAVRRFAEGTKVSVESSRGEITGILAKHGVVRMAWATGPDGDHLQFELEGGQYRLDMTRPTAESLRERDGHEYAYPQNIDWHAKAEAEWRRRWRANVLLLKAKLEFIEGGDTTLDRELATFRVLKDGRTLGEVMDSGGLPLLTAGK